MNPVQYIIADHTLKMTPGKLAVQVAHASVEGLRRNAKEPWGNPWDASIVNRWYRAGHYAKVVLQTDDIRTAAEYLKARGIESTIIIDEGRTEFTGDLTVTALGCPVLDKDEPHVRETFSAFKLYGTAPGKPIGNGYAPSSVDSTEGSLSSLVQDLFRMTRQSLGEDHLDE